MMQTITDLARVLAMLFLTGLPVMFVASVIAAFAVDRARKRTIRVAEEAGVEITLKPDRGLSAMKIQGIGYCIGFIIIGVIGVVVSVLGISLPLDLSEDLETIIGTSVLGIFDVLLWGITIWIPFYYRAERRRLQRVLEDALSKKGA